MARADFFLDLAVKPDTREGVKSVESHLTCRSLHSLAPAVRLCPSMGQRQADSTALTGRPAEQCKRTGHDIPNSELE